MTHGALRVGIPMHVPVVFRQPDSKVMIHIQHTRNWGPDYVAKRLTILHSIITRHLLNIN